MDINQLDCLKKVQLEIMDEIHRVCKKNSVRYYLVYGTLLGAVRHKGFIPWDVDIDIAMPRKDYDRFKELCKDELSEQFFYCDHTTEKYYQQPHALVCKRNTGLYTKYDKLNPINKNYGIYVDVFPLDKAPDDTAERVKHARALRRLYRLKELSIPYSYSSSSLKRKLHHALSALLFFLSPTRINEKLHREKAKYENTSARCLCAIAGDADEKEYIRQCFPAEMFSEPEMLEFEGRKFCCPKDSTAYLTQMYGDYMTPPPKEQQRVNLELFTEIETGNINA
ncbi:MAG: LicD family protein [Clostridia bacterium]|nr:LicD family protein [Clostridia bacterium]